MCYSQMVKQGLKKGLRWKARIQPQMFEELFRRRLEDKRVKIAKALEANFYVPETEVETRIKGYIDEYRARLEKDYEADLFKQRRRLADAERKLKTKSTKSALENQRIAGEKIDWLRDKLDELHRTELKAKDSRIFPFWYAPVFVWENGEFVIKPMRYHCRQAGKPETIDKMRDGLYNARRDNLTRFWRNQFGHKHGFIISTSFYENVARHTFEHRALRPGERESSVQLHFNPQPGSDMFVACLWDHWEMPGQPDLYSFAAITDEPPPEVAETGHDRFIIPLKEKNLQAWLTPEGRSLEELQQILDDRERPYYQHQQIAA